MIFVTVGTHYFDGLTRAIDRAVGDGRIADEVILQIGHGGSYRPEHCRYFRAAPTIEPFERAADLIIGHGGTGTTLEILLMGKPLMSVSNPMMQDNHQHEFLEALEGMGLVTYCRDVDTLPEVIARKPKEPPTLPAISSLALELQARFAELPPRRTRRGWLGRFAERRVAAYEVARERTARTPRDHGSVWELLTDPRTPAATAF